MNDPPIQAGENGDDGCPARTDIDLATVRFTFLGKSIPGAALATLLHLADDTPPTGQGADPP